MKHITVVFISLLFLSSCNSRNTEWKQTSILKLDNISPIGITVQDNYLWVSDGDNNRLVKLDLQGKIVETFDEFQRPMHLTNKDGVLYIPEYGSDSIVKFEGNKKSFLKVPEKLDAPAAIDFYEEEIAIADFYNHRIVYFNGKDWKIIGKKGNKKGELFYPTDIKIEKKKIVVADAYNNRVQLFDKEGNSLKVIGKEEKMNAATGLFSNGKEIFITDFENDRVLVYNYEGTLLQIIKEGLNKPIDALVFNDTLYIINYAGKSIFTFNK